MTSFRQFEITAITTLTVLTKKYKQEIGDLELSDCVHFKNVSWTLSEDARISYYLDTKLAAYPHIQNLIKEKLEMLVEGKIYVDGKVKLIETKPRARDPKKETPARILTGVVKACKPPSKCILLLSIWVFTFVVVSSYEAGVV